MTYLPMSWSCTVSGLGNLNAVWSTGVAADGTSTLILTLTGVASSSGNITLVNNTSGDSVFIPKFAGAKVAGGINAAVGPANGHLLNLYSANVLISQQYAAGTTRPNFWSLNSPTANVATLTNITLQSASAGTNSAGSGYPLSDENLSIPGQSTAVDGNWITPPTDWSLYGEAPTPTAKLSSAVVWGAGPVSATITFSHAQTRVRQ